MKARFNTIQVGPSIYKRINLSEKLSLIPGIRFTKDFYTTKSSVLTHKTNYWGRVYQVSAIYSKIQVTASANKTISDNYFAIAIGIVFPA